jgi:hypothetical protein
MVTLEQLQATARWHTELHFTGRHECRINVGPRGGMQESITRVRQSGAIKTWKRTPGKFRMPVKFGLYESGAVDQDNTRFFHLRENCPALIEWADFQANQTA